MLFNLTPSHLQIKAYFRNIERNMQEIERKFLVTDAVRDVLKYLEPKAIRQGYIMDENGQTVRVRTKGTKGFLTIKGKAEGISRTEFEYEIPYEDAVSLLNDFCKWELSKDRYELQFSEKCWEIDVFHGKHEGLILAEVELMDENEAVELPLWVKEDVRLNPIYFNSNLVKS